MAEFESYRERVTQGLQDLRDVLDLRQKLGIGAGISAFGSMSYSVMASIVNGKPEPAMYSVIDGEKIGLGTEHVDASWLRAMDKVATAEGLQAARDREDAAGQKLSYYDLKKGMQVILGLDLRSNGSFTYSVTEFSLKDPNDKGTVIASHSGGNLSTWLNSSECFLSQILDNDFQDWMGMMRKRVVGAENWFPLAQP
jgi:hypothetical protein